MPLCGSSNPLPYFDITGIKVFNLKESGLTANPNEEISVTKYNLALNLEATYYSSLRFSGFGTFACSPVESGFKGSKEKIDYIKISCDKDYDDKHPANSSLNDLIVIGFYYLGKAPTQTFDEKIKENNFMPKSVSEFNFLTFKTSPLKKQSLTFAVEYALTNGEKYIARTLPVVIY